MIQSGIQTGYFSDILIIGAGIIGLTLAWELKQRYPDLKITVLEKESGLAKHASGRNSGVLHSGVYYPPHSLKAQVCAEGARLLAAYCKENHLPLHRVGKVILPVEANQQEQLEHLLQQGLANQAHVETPIHVIDAQQLKQIEPNAFSVTGKALYLPHSAVFDPVCIVRHLAAQLESRGVTLLLDQKISRMMPHRHELISNHARFNYGMLLNTAGLHADIIAKAFGLGQRYAILPFKGLYYELSPKSKLAIKGHVYPVPDLRFPFLGVHFTKSVSGKVYVGPTAIPAFGRENYAVLQGLDLLEAPSIAYRLACLYALDRQGMRQFTHQEGVRFFKPKFVEAARTLVPALRSEDLIPSAKVGIRAQLLDLQTRSFVMDFLVARGDRSLHILNAVSPAFTSAFQFARFILDYYFESDNKLFIPDHENSLLAGTRGGFA